MADQDAVNPGAIPPKVSPFDKPDSAAPAKPAAPGAPRPITVRLSKKPITVTKAKPAAAPVAAPAAPVTPAMPAAVGAITPPPANPRATSRVPIPETVAATPTPAIRPATVRLRPVTPPMGVVTPRAGGSTQPIAQVDAGGGAPAALPLQPQSPPTPGSNPLPAGPKPPSSAQVQAAKSKTSRISLDSAIGVAPVGPEADIPKTIRLKRPTELSASVTATQKSVIPPVRQTSRIPDSALPTGEGAGSDSASVTQKKTLKIKRPGLKEETGAGVSAGGDGFPEGVQLTPVNPMLDLPPKEESTLFTTIAVFVAAAAAVVLLLLSLCLGAHAMGPDAGKNSLASISGPALPWPGRIVD